MDSSTPKGVPIEIIVKIKPEAYQRQDLRIYENKISLLDQNDRAVDEFITNGYIFEQADCFRNNFDQVFKKYLSAIIQGVNLTILNFGAKSTGKTFSYEGNQEEAGIYSLFVENLFLTLENKRETVLEEIQASGNPELEGTSFTYNIKMKFIELKDEQAIDLLQKFNYYKAPTQVVYTETEGFTVNGAAWVGVSDSLVFADLFSEAVKFRTNYDYNKVNKSSTLLIFEITQILENRLTRDLKHMVSRIYCYDLPSADILSEPFRNLSNSIEYKSIYSFQTLMAELAKNHNNVLPSFYEASLLTKMLKETVGAGGLCLGVFCLQNNNFPLSSIVFKIMKLCSHVQNYPIVMDTNSMSLIKKFRVDVNYYSKYGIQGNKPEYKPVVANNILPEKYNPPLIPNVPIDNHQVEELKRKLALAENELGRMNNELQYAEEENKRLLFALSRKREREMAMQNYQPYEPYNNLKQIDEHKEEINEIMVTVNDLVEKVKDLKEERRKYEEEISELKAANQRIASELEKTMTDANNLKINTDNEVFNLREIINSTKNELEYMRNESEKYKKIQSDLMLEIDEREVQFKKTLEDREREIEINMLELTQNEKRRLESELREVTRKLEHFADENKDYNRLVDDLKKENSKFNLKISEMRNTLRETMQKNLDKDSKARLVKSYSDREIELNEIIGIEKAKADNIKEKLKKMKTYGRKIRNIALDYFPINEELPELLTKDLEIFIEEAENESVVQFLEFEIRTLRERNKKLEYEMSKIREETKLNKPYTNSNTKYIEEHRKQSKPHTEELNIAEVQRKLMDEIEKLKNARPVSVSKDIERIKREKEQLLDENKKLKLMINDNLLGMENGSEENSAVLKQKIIFLEKSLQNIERERSELSVRATMAEEQLKTFQELMNQTSQQYQRKILELNKRLDAAEMRTNHRNYYNQIND